MDNLEHLLNNMKQHNIIILEELTELRDTAATPGLSIVDDIDRIIELVKGIQQANEHRT